jgi:hypothetical protein
VRHATIVVVGLALVACGEPAAAPPATSSPTLAPRWQGRTAEEWVPFLASDVRALRFDALWAMGELGPPTPEGIAAVRAALSGAEGADADLELAAAFAVRRWGANAPADLAPALLRVRAWRPLHARALAEMGGSAVPALRAALAADEPAGATGRALAAVANVGAEGEPLASDVLRLAREGASRDVRLAAGRALGRLGTAGAEAAIGLLAADDLDLGEAARRGLARGGESALVSLRGALGRLGDEEAAAVADVLAAMGPRAAAAVPDLARALRRTGPVRFNAADALVAVGEPARAELERLARDDDADVARLAADALGRLPAP